MKRLIIAGIGNIFFGDDAFGVEVVRAMTASSQPEGVDVRDFGIRGMDLALTLTAGEYAGAILVDVVQRGEAPGSLFVIEPDRPDSASPIPLPEGHGMTPEKVLALATQFGELCPWIRVVGCEPGHFGSEDDPAMGLSEPVAAVVPRAINMVEALARDFLDLSREAQDNQ